MIISTILVLVTSQAIYASENSYEGFDPNDFIASEEYLEYQNSDRLYLQYIVTLKTTYGSEIIRASDPGEAAAIKAYLLRKYGIKATEVTPTFVPITE